MTEPTAMKLITVTESTYCPRYCNDLTLDISYFCYYMVAFYLLLYFPYWCSFLLGYSFLSSLISIPHHPSTQLGNHMILLQYYWISTPVAIPYLFDSITCFVCYILSPLNLCFRT